MFGVLASVSHSVRILLVLFWVVRLVSASIFLVSLFLTIMKPALAVSREGAYPAVSKLQLLSSKGSSITSIIQLKAMKQLDSSSERQ
jgi:hypothetical protein